MNKMRATNNFQLISIFSLIHFYYTALNGNCESHPNPGKVRRSGWREEKESIANRKGVLDGVGDEFLCLLDGLQ